MKLIQPRPDRFGAILHECEAHQKRIRQAKARCGDFFPLNPESYAALTDEQVEHVDQLVYRFSKLQDALGSKLFPAIVSAVREDAASLTVLDGLNELERAGVLDSADQWTAMRQIRNELAHDYQDEPEAGSRSLNDVYHSVDELTAIGESAAAFVRERILPSLESE
jgi:hypothetical protein